MEIKPYKSKYHKFLLVFEFNWDILNFLKDIQQKHGWQNLSFLDDGKEKGWAFSDENVFNEIIDRFPYINYPDVVWPEKSKIKKIDITKLKPIEAKTLIPLFDFQKKTLDFIEKCGGKSLLALDMGLGKSCTAIGYGVYKQFGRVLIVCPASVKENWRREIKRFAGIKANLLSNENNGGWEIINYEQLKNFEDYLLREHYDLVVFDESHMIKSSKAIRTKLSIKIAKKADNMLFLTGTPVLNKPIEIYTVMNLITPIKSWDFKMRFCAAKKTDWGWNFDGASNLDELRAMMYFMIRISKEEVLNQLPEKTVDIIETSITPEGKKEYEKVRDEYREWILENKKNINAIFAEALTKVNYLKQVVVAHKNIEEILDEFLENGKKLIVFSQYRETVERLYRKYSNQAVKLTGGTKTEDRQPLIDIFNTNDQCKMFISTLKAGGVGINLTAADTVVFTDLDWVPASHFQAEDRAHRFGQKNNVNVYYLITHDTIEEKIWKLLRRKEKVVNQILAGDDNVRKVRIKTLLKNI